MSVRSLIDLPKTFVRDRNLSKKPFEYFYKYSIWSDVNFVGVVHAGNAIIKNQDLQDKLLRRFDGSRYLRFKGFFQGMKVW